MRHADTIQGESMLNRVLILMLCCGAMLVAGCTKPVEGAAPEDKQPASAGGASEREVKKPESERILIPVEVSNPKRADISAYFETTTRIVAENRVEVLSKGTGVCLSVNAEEGDRVKAGAVLAELDKTQTVLIQVLNASPHGKLIELLDICTKLGMNNISVISSGGA